MRDKKRFKVRTLNRQMKKEGSKTKKMAMKFNLVGFLRSMIMKTMMKNE